MSPKNEARTLDFAGSGLDALLVVAESAKDPDLAPFVGAARLGESFLLAPAAASPALGYFTAMEREEAASAGLDLLTPESLEIPRLAQEGRSSVEILGSALRRALSLRGLAPSANGASRLGLAGSGKSGHVYEAAKRLEAEGWQVVSGHDLVRRFRKAKTDAEIAQIEAAAEATVAAFRWLADQLAATVDRQGELWLEGETLTVARLKDGIAEVLGRRGFSQPEGGIVAPGGEGAVPHNSGTPHRVLRSGESLVVDLFPKGQMFADCTRTFCVGEPTEALSEAHAAVLEALQQSHRECLPGATGWQLQEATCERLARAGYDTPITTPGNLRGYVHGLGHGVGYELHEQPSFGKRDRDQPAGRIEVRDVLTLEPGLYDSEAGFGVRLEDLVVVEEEGPRNLTCLPYELDPRAWG